MTQIKMCLEHGSAFGDFDYCHKALWLIACDKTVSPCRMVDRHLVAIVDIDRDALATALNIWGLDHSLRNDEMSEYIANAARVVLDALSA